MQSTIGVVVGDELRILWDVDEAVHDAQCGLAN
jgi:hypothetical protein